MPPAMKALHLEISIARLRVADQRRPETTTYPAVVDIVGGYSSLLRKERSDNGHRLFFFFFYLLTRISPLALSPQDGRREYK